MNSKTLAVICIAFATCTTGFTADAEATRVACIGDSITAGARVDAATESYPARLQQMLGDRYEVRNFGLGSATLLKSGRPNIWQKLPDVQEFRPHIVVISLGTNDTVGGKRKNWEQIDRFDADYSELIVAISQLSTMPRIVLCTPTSMVLQTKGLAPARLANLQERKPRLQQLCRQIRQLAQTHGSKNVSLVDLNSVLRDRPGLVTIADGVHPNREGYSEIARAVAEHLRSDEFRELASQESDDE